MKTLINILTIIAIVCAFLAFFDGLEWLGMVALGIIVILFITSKEFRKQF